MRVVRTRLRVGESRRGRLDQLAELASAPLWLAAARLSGLPGTAIHVRAALAAARSLVRGASASSRADLLGLVAQPLDGCRYFELDAVERRTPPLSGGARYLDVASPRLVPLGVLARTPRLHADLLNPDVADAARTRALAADFGVERRCRFHERRVEDSGLEAGSFDLVTCVSVVEHIPDDVAAIEALARLVAPRGRVVLSVPCAREGVEEWVDWDEYGLQGAGEGTFVLGQRMYDPAALEQRFFSRLGRPETIDVFGERAPGRFVANRAWKLAGPRYPHGKEPWLARRDWRRFASIGELPGWGVAVMRFAPNGD